MNGSRLRLSEHHVKLDEYVELIKKWDRIHSLVSRGDREFLELRHIKDSLMAEPFLKPSGTHLDIGTGAGFPGVPLAIARPDVHVVLNDRSANKCRFLREVKLRLELTNVEILECDVGRRSVPQRHFDTISLRAVAAPAMSWLLGSLLLKPNGLVLLYTQERFRDDSLMFKQGVVRSCTPSVRGWITAIAKCNP